MLLNDVVVGCCYCDCCLSVLNEYSNKQQHKQQHHYIHQRRSIFDVNQCGATHSADLGGSSKYSYETYED